jgi:hypothetical protein
MYIMLCERAIGSTCGVHELTYGQFSNLNLINYIQISNFIFFAVYIKLHTKKYTSVYVTRQFPNLNLICYTPN